MNKALLHVFVVLLVCSCAAYAGPNPEWMIFITGLGEDGVSGIGLGTTIGTLEGATDGTDTNLWNGLVDERETWLPGLAPPEWEWVYAGSTGQKIFDIRAPMSVGANYTWTLCVGGGEGYGGLMGISFRLNAYLGNWCDRELGLGSKYMPDSSLLFELRDNQGNLLMSFTGGGDDLNRQYDITGLPNAPIDDPAIYTLTATAVPEPGSFVALGLGITLVGYRLRRRR